MNIRDALDSIATRHPHLIGKFGGHGMAAGLSLSEEHLAEFKLAFAAEVAARADRESLTGVIYSDGPLGPDEMSLDTARMLRGAGPWGQGFPEPVFDGEFRILEARIVGGKHLKLRLEDPRGRAAPIEAIAFGHPGSASGELQLSRGARVQLAYRLEINAYLGIERVQLNCQHIKLQ